MSSNPSSKPVEPLNEIEVTEPVRDAASVILVRPNTNGQPGLQAFMLRRSASTTVMNSAYVFPGGKVDPEDAHQKALDQYRVPVDAAHRINEPDLDPALAAALFVAACRECEEECGVSLTADDLIPFSRWITPKTPAMMKRRFDTRFFLACLPPDASAIHDGVEADASEWMGPRDALAAYCATKITLAPPQIMTLAAIARFDSYPALADSLAGHRAPLIEPLGIKHEDGSRTICYPGDPKHAVSQPAFSGPTRLVWRKDHFEPEAGPEAFFS
ncbi:MAG: NUDIX hydrolase [Burkholderiaceae bacterium]